MFDRKLARESRMMEGSVSEDVVGWDPGNRSPRGWTLRVGGPGCDLAG